MLDALLVLADGEVFLGKSIGASGHCCGEVVFNTAMTGYQEILTDPSYTQQIVTLTYPHVGNTGVNLEDVESKKINLSGLIIRNTPTIYSNFRATQSLSDYLKQQNIVAIAEVDTRKLTRHLRTLGSISGCILTLDKSYSYNNIDPALIKKAQNLALEFGSMNGKDLTGLVSCEHNYEFKQGSWQLAGFKNINNPDLHVVAYDFGIKTNILRMLCDLNAKVTVVPSATTVEDVLKLKPDGIFLSNGPGDPKPCDYAIENIKQILQLKIPLFGICLGHQLLGLAVGGDTKKMPFGHHGANHPVQDLNSKKVLISSQNHGFEVDENSLPEWVEVTHKSLFDGTVQGLSVKNQCAFSFQGHPEASPGPCDMGYLFNHFGEQMRAYKRKNS